MDMGLFEAEGVCGGGISKVERESNQISVLDLQPGGGLLILRSGVMLAIVQRWRLCNVFR
jgi:hypothetical protein